MDDVWHVFRFCPRCGTGLALTHGEDGPALRCPADGFVFYQNPHTATAAVIRNTAGEYLFVRRAKEPQRGGWDLIGGFVNWGEDPVAAIAREVKEELGATFTPAGILCVAHDWYPFNGLQVSVNTIVFTGELTGDITPNDEIGAVHWLATDALPTDSVSFASVQRAIDLIRQRS